ncbi:hypothetical protein TrLO_g13619 [Triparma laevis f. longispina]|uniref:Uncharacterized protein n=1 Tax=Triparma laevis f. longispina TaxID=1714387 RepID=A0A9W7A160_9STRA|nr:hypothetical protein TrLO_g13619 [Triparma laevis f. longispina]
MLFSAAHSKLGESLTYVINEIAALKQRHQQQAANIPNGPGYNAQFIHLAVEKSDSQRERQEVNEKLSALMTLVQSEGAELSKAMDEIELIKLLMHVKHTATDYGYATYYLEILGKLLSVLVDGEMQPQEIRL